MEGLVEEFGSEDDGEDQARTQVLDLDEDSDALEQFGIFRQEV